MKFLNWIVQRYLCYRYGHAWQFEEDSLDGFWIRCIHCHKLEEYLPGVHEPKGIYLWQK